MLLAIYTKAVFPYMCAQDLNNGSLLKMGGFLSQQFAEDHLVLRLIMSNLR